jgi:hypothetical protein
MIDLGDDPDGDVEGYDGAQPTVEIGGVTMTQEQFDAARYPLLYPPSDAKLLDAPAVKAPAPNPYAFKDGAEAFNFGLLVGYLREALDGSSVQAHPTIDNDRNYLAIVRIEKQADVNGPEQGWLLGMVR